MYRINAGILIPGRGDPISDGCLVIERGVIVYAGKAEGAPAAPGATEVVTEAVMPGMWDCHGHFAGLTRPDIEQSFAVPEAMAALRGLTDANRALMAGFTSIREPGGFGFYLARAINEGTTVGPHIYSAAGALSQTGGHGDIHAFPLAAIEHTPLFELCDGVPECLKAVRKQLRRGALLIKVCASGGVMSEVDHPIHQQFSEEELRAIVEEAARADRIVAAHCHGKPGIMAALEAGARTIEHGTYLDREAAQLMIEKGAVLVPTRFIVEQLLALKDQLPRYAYEKAVMISDQHWQAVQIAISEGVRIAVGTDIFTTGELWGRNGQELSLLVKAGMTPLAAIESATANGPLTLGPQAPQSGLLAEGYDADVLGLDANPLEDILSLSGPEHVTHIWKRGELIKGAG
ncbi:MAG: amidohydrolase family protein [Acidimicrobiia bacterium]